MSGLVYCGFKTMPKRVTDSALPRRFSTMLEPFNLLLSPQGS
jgi:hypothetical protein